MRSFMGVEELTDEWLRVQSEDDRTDLLHDALSLAASVSANVVAGKLKPFPAAMSLHPAVRSAGTHIPVAMRWPLAAVRGSERVREMRHVPGASG